MYEMPAVSEVIQFANLIMARRGGAPVPSFSFRSKKRDACRHCLSPSLLCILWHPLCCPCWLIDHIPEQGKQRCFPTKYLVNGASSVVLSTVPAPMQCKRISTVSIAGGSDHLASNAGHSCTSVHLPIASAFNFQASGSRGSLTSVTVILRNAYPRLCDSSCSLPELVQYDYKGSCYFFVPSGI